MCVHDVVLSLFVACNQPNHEQDDWVHCEGHIKYVHCECHIKNTRSPKNTARELMEQNVVRAVLCHYTHLSFHTLVLCVMRALGVIVPVVLHLQ